MKPVLTHPSWHDIEKQCSKIAINILQDHIQIDRIVGLARGGLVPAVILSHVLGVKMIPVCYSSKAGRGEYKQYDNTFPTIPDNAPNVLIVDDICDSGHTLNEVAAHYETCGKTVYTAALYFKLGAIMIPTWHAERIPEDSPWIIFPFE